jgi:hypothetical protein
VGVEDGGDLAGRGLPRAGVLGVYGVDVPVDVVEGEGWGEVEGLEDAWLVEEGSEIALALIGAVWEVGASDADWKYMLLAV